MNRDASAGPTSSLSCSNEFARTGFVITEHQLEERGFFWILVSRIGNVGADNVARIDTVYTIVKDSVEAAHGGEDESLLAGNNVTVRIPETATPAYRRPLSTDFLLGRLSALPAFRAVPSAFKPFANEKTCIWLSA